MTYLWRLSDPEHQRAEAEAAVIANTMVVTTRADGSFTISLPALAKLLDPHNVCLCPACLLTKPQA